MTDIERNELTQNAMGGTELMATWLKERLNPELEKQFQIICSRVREIDENRIYHSTPHRGLQILVPVFEHLQKTYPNIELDVYSSFKLYGWEQRDEPYKELFAQMDANPNIHNHGTVSNDEIRAAVQKADVFAYPNIWPETSCLCAIEALMAGCLMVHPNYCALPETAADWGINYQWMPEANDHANLFATVLESIVNTIATDKSVVENMQHQQSIYYQNNYTWERRIPEWEQMLNHVLFEREHGK